MINALPGRPIRNNVSRTLERFHTYLLVVLGVAFIGTGITAIGVVTTSPATVAVGAGALVGAGFYKGKRKRALALEHLTEARRILSQFGQTPILARVETALAELG